MKRSAASSKSLFNLVRTGKSRLIRIRGAHVRKPLVRTITVLTAAGLLLTACSSSSSKSAANSKAPVVIGVNTSVTGSLASVIYPWTTTYRAYINYANAHGGINGRKIQLDVLDNAGSVATAASNAIKLATVDHVVAMLGPEITSTCSAAIPTADRYQVPLICGFVAPTNLSPVEKYVYNMWQPEEQSIAGQVVETKKLLGNTPVRLALVDQNLGGPQQWAAQAVSVAKANHWSVVASVETGIVSVSANALAATLAAAKPNIVWFDPSPVTEQPLYNAMKADGLNPPIIVIGNADYSLTAQIADPKMYVQTAASFVLPSTAGSGAALFRKYMAKEGITSVGALNGPISNEAAWLGAQDLVAALRSCDACTGNALVKALDTTVVSSPGISSGYGFTASSHIPFKSYYLYQWDAATGLMRLVKSDLPAGPN